MITNLEFSQNAEGVYETSFYTTLDAVVQISKDNEEDVTVEASSDGTNYTMIMPPRNERDILLDVGLPSGYIVRLRTLYQPSFAAVIAKTEIQPAVPDALNFTMPNGGTITLTKTGTPFTVSLEYTIDGGTTWTEWVEVNSVRTLTLQAGEKVYIRNTSTSSTGFSTSTSSYYIFTSDTTGECGGNVNSLLCKNPSDAVLSNYCFNALFYGNSSKFDFGNLVLPSTQLYPYCYRQMFLSNKSITNPPTMLATQAAEGCFQSMFESASNLIKSPEIYIGVLADGSGRWMFHSAASLSEIRVHFTDITASNCLGGWVTGVAASGDFYCPQVLTIPTGVNGIPSGWTRHDL